MKKAYTVALCALAILVLSWFLPWLYSLALPDGGNDPFVAFSPLSSTFIISENHGEDGTEIYAASSDGARIDGTVFTREQRDSLLPHIYFTQLSGRNALPDTICGKAAGIAVFRHSQWILNSSPRDINAPSPGVWMMMESMPERFDLEDASEVFSLSGNQVTFTAMADNSSVPARSKRFTRAFADAGFTYPPRHLNANVTTRKAYDEGYLIVDGAGALFHVKMQAGRPYIARFNAPDSVDFTQAFILENNDTRFLGIAADSRGQLYALEHAGYRAVPLPVRPVDLTANKVTVMKNLYNIIVKVTDSEASYWTALDSDTYSLLGSYSYQRQPSSIAVARGYIFPYVLTFTATTDRFVHPRISDISLRALPLNFLLALILFFLLPGKSRVCRLGRSGLTLIFGIFSFIPFAIIKD